MVEDANLDPEDREVLAALSDPLDVEAFRNIIDSARAQDKTGVELVREDPAHTSRKAVRRACLKNRWASLAAMFRSVFRTSRHTPGPASMDFPNPPRR